MDATVLKLKINNLEETYEFNKVAKQASGAVFYRQGKAVLLATVAIDERPVEEDFLPMTVQYIEKSYAAAKIPGGFIKRETKPGDFETLTSRIIDRSLRPLFPKGFRYPVVITVTVLSSDSEVDMQVAALHAASAALFVSDTPISQAVAAVRLAKIDGEIVVNPTLSQQDESKLDLFVAGSGKDILMIEMRTMAQEIIDDVVAPTMAEIPLILEHHECNELDEEALLEAIGIAQKAISKATEMYGNEFAPASREPLVLELFDEKVDSELYDYIAANYQEAVEEAVQSMAKSERSTALKKVRASIMEAKASEGVVVEKELVGNVLEAYKRTIVRGLILDKGIRADGRALDEVRPIEIETNILPSVHGSCLFTRGQTQALVTATLGTDKDAQMYELITEKNTLSERFMVHYNFPGYSVGEAKPVSAPGRRELGHGNLAKRALEPTIDIRRDGTVRIVSEILESNGSSSMATVCGGALALRAAGVETQKLVAGVAMGLVTEDEKYAVLTDIMGLEDHDGDMDFKITGTCDGITAMQMDIKLGGLELHILKDALDQAKKARLHILEIMERADEEMQPSGALPTVEHFTIDPSRIVDIIGKAGATIREIIEKFDVSIDLDREVGGVKVSGGDDSKVAAAKEHIESIASRPVPKQMQYEINKQYTGKIKKIVDFGMFVEMPDGFDALLHISKVSKGRVDNLAERYHEGDEIEVVVLEQKGKKVELATPEYLV
ncbi:polyribonucleotide nucleotidyltransferase [Sulfurovum sp.]|jgi:polyribonucleotide nucleotidyltransferase|uniref:polyribonucleotide nucleotidyltransferase n=1 Tax=Sulfurovum sp. TaxID=1969726 RepID=UPI002A3658D8|nr:polyribonucleotide nucleotidyltransferase [Sulfurovum sp.]MDD2451733.1 polyribonucleotide nucleotidyltransferase [Sulfurovum sp.]MDD3500245.1 polyribonucleotide nucleotidyltransferase [Sulfurovum sp.]MDY0402411.1 polyribonucleotide nucleotidyltransferase [Sulfurovum sp.]